MTPLHGINFVKSNPKSPNDNVGHSVVLKHLSHAKTPKNPVLWRLEDEGERYKSVVTLHRESDGYLLSIECEGRGQFLISDSEISIFWSQEGTSFEHYLQTFGASLFLELKGVPCLHANLLEKDGKGILLIAPSRMGKSSLSANLCKFGFQLATDDMCAIYDTKDGQFCSFPSWSKLRLWPDSTDEVLHNVDVVGLRSVHERFSKSEVAISSSLDANKTIPLTAAFILERQASSSASILNQSLTPSFGLMLLIQNSMLADAYQPLGIEQTRLKKLAQIVETIPFYQLQYPSGYDVLDNVSERISQIVN